jgi:hypothetical protein
VRKQLVGRLATRCEIFACVHVGELCIFKLCSTQVACDSFRQKLCSVNRPLQVVSTACVVILSESTLNSTSTKCLSS